MKCNEEWGCGKETKGLFTVWVVDWDDLKADPDDGTVAIRVCRDCAAEGDWAHE